MQLVLLDPGDLEQVRGRVVAPHLGGRVGSAHVQDPDAAVLIAAALVDRLEQAGDLHLDVADVEQALEQRPGLLVIAVLTDDRAEQIRGPEHVLLMADAQGRALAAELVAEIAIVDELGPATEQLLELVEVVVLPALGVHLREQLDGRQVVGDQVEQLLGRDHRGLAVAEHLTGDLDDPPEQLTLLALVEDHVDAAAVQLEQLLMGAAAAQQRLERLVGGLVGLVALEDLGVGLLGVGRTLEIVAPDRAELEQQVAAQVGLGPLERAALGLGVGGLAGDVV